MVPAYYHHHASTGNWLAHLIIRGVVYKIIFRTPMLIAVIVGVGALLYIMYSRKRVKK